MWLVFVLYALFASVFTVSKEALQHASPCFLVGFRMTVAGVLLLLITRWKASASLTISPRAWKKIGLLALLNIYLTNVFEFWGLQYLTSFKACFIYSLSPFASALFSYLLLNERLTVKKWLGLLIGFAAFVPMLLSQTSFEEAAGQLGVFSFAELAVVGAALSSVFGWILLKQLVDGEKVPPMVANGYSMTIGGALALLHSLGSEAWQPVPVTDIAPFLGCTLFLIIVSNFICYNLYGTLLKRFSATFLSLAGFSTPLFTALFGKIFHNEATTGAFWLSLAGVGLGLVVFYYDEIQLRETKKSVAFS